jgi:hypothetical protein
MIAPQRIQILLPFPLPFLLESKGDPTVYIAADETISEQRLSGICLPCRHLTFPNDAAWNVLKMFHRIGNPVPLSTDDSLLYSMFIS